MVVGSKDLGIDIVRMNSHLRGLSAPLANSVGSNSFDPKHITQHDKSKAMKRFHKTLQSGMTLLEITVVLLILIALAGLVVPYVSITSGTATCQATDATLQAVRQAIMGGAAGPGYYADTLGTYPADRGDTDYNLKYLFVAGDSNGADPVADWPEYNPQTGVGWRGPYLMTGVNLAKKAALASHFSSTTYVHALADDDSIVNDGWGRPIILQIPATCSVSPNPSDCARLVSAGPGTGPGLSDADIDTTIADDKADTTRSDDRVLFLKIADPGNNKRCDER
jgi:type II secretory pathway pseudopilin PulG